MPERQVIEADLTLLGDAFERGIRISIDETGSIESLGSQGPPVTRRLHDCALLPGMVNAHSHAFQRGLRGRGERFPAGAGSFWSWRDEMYNLVESMDEAAIYRLSRQAFEEMLDAGITTVGEFHYLHHDQSGQGFALDAVVLRAAADAGIRIVLLNAYYRQGGFDEPLRGGQRRFNVPSPEAYWRRMEELASIIDRPTQSLGVVVHSIRAAPLEDLIAIHAEARRRGLVFHMHVEEQREEIDGCIAHHGSSPMALLNERLLIDHAFTAVHCTHTDPADMARYLQAGGTVCICPLTEANLGDGVPDVPGILAGKGRISLGSDSNARISLLEEMRSLEYVQRLVGERRGVCVDERGSVAHRLWRAATADGARSLGVSAGLIQAGAPADFITLDLNHAALAGWSDETLLDAFILGTGEATIDGVCVGGGWVRGG